MKYKLIFSLLFCMSFQSQASEVYIEGNRVALALEEIYGSGAGVGAKNNSCLLCHSSNSGGLGNLNASFGNDFSLTALDVVGNSGGGSLPATGAINSLEAIFRDTDFQDQDSDGDGVSNGDEFQANTDPADDVSGSSGSSSSGGDSGGCGMISGPGSSPPPGAFLLLLLPLVFLGLIRWRKFAR